MISKQPPSPEQVGEGLNSRIPRNKQGVRVGFAGLVFLGAGPDLFELVSWSSALAQQSLELASYRFFQCSLVLDQMCLCSPFPIPQHTSLFSFPGFPASKSAQKCVLVKGLIMIGIGVIMVLFVEGGV